MNLDHPQDYKKIDHENMLDHIQRLPDQLDLAWRLGMNLVLPTLGPVSQIILAGMGGSAIGADLLAAYVRGSSSVPVIVSRDYGLPAWAKNAGTLLIASSHSGNTEETLSAYAQARRHQIQCIVVTTGGRLAEMATQDGVGVWRFEHSGQPRSAVGFSFGLLLALLSRLQLISGPDKEIKNTITLMKRQQAQIDPSLPVMKNAAKDLALRISGKFPVIFGADILAPVGRRWKGQINELAKQWAQAEEIPEADHNVLAGTRFPGTIQSNYKFIFLSAAAQHERNQLRMKLTSEIFEKNKLDVELFEAAGESPLSNMWTAIHFGDYLAYYLALINNVDPTPIALMTNLKDSLKSVSPKSESPKSDPLKSHK